MKRSRRHMRDLDPGTKLFWGLVLVILAISAFYGSQVERTMLTQRSASGTLASGDLVHLVNVVDGDTVRVARAGEEPAAVRLIGIKSFDAKVEKDDVTPFAQSAAEELKRRLTGRSVRVLLDPTPQDKYGRWLATLYADDHDVGLDLVRAGLVVVYTVHPFPAMQLYLQEQRAAERARRGLWGNQAASKRAAALQREWREQPR